MNHFNESSADSTISAPNHGHNSSPGFEIGNFGGTSSPKPSPQPSSNPSAPPKNDGFVFGTPVTVFEEDIRISRGGFGGKLLTRDSAHVGFAVENCSRIAELCAHYKTFLRISSQTFLPFDGIASVGPYTVFYFMKEGGEVPLRALSPEDKRRYAVPIFKQLLSVIYNDYFLDILAAHSPLMNNLPHRAFRCLSMDTVYVDVSTGEPRVRILPLVAENGDYPEEFPRDAIGCDGNAGFAADLFSAIVVYLMMYNRADTLTTASADLPGSQNSDLNVLLLRALSPFPAMRPSKEGFIHALPQEFRPVEYRDGYTPPRKKEAEEPVHRAPDPGRRPELHGYYRERHSGGPDPVSPNFGKSRELRQDLMNLFRSLMPDRWMNRFREAPGQVEATDLSDTVFEEEPDYDDYE